TGEQISYGQLRDTMPHDRRVHFIPDAHLVVSIPKANDRLVLQRFNIDEAVARSGIDYLLVTSRPPAAFKGTAYEYQLVVKSKKGGVKYRVGSGPPGMKISAAGRLTWAVPPDHAEAHADVILTVSDAAGQEIFHSFK